jgi:hypothetical protein
MAVHPRTDPSPADGIASSVFRLKTVMNQRDGTGDVSGTADAVGTRDEHQCGLV